MSHNSTYMNHFQDSGSVGHSGVGAAGSCLNRGDSGSIVFTRENYLVVQSPAVQVLEVTPDHLFRPFLLLFQVHLVHSVPSVLVHSSASARPTEFIHCLMVFKA